MGILIRQVGELAGGFLVRLATAGGSRTSLEGVRRDVLRGMIQELESMDLTIAVKADLLGQTSGGYVAAADRVTAATPMLSDQVLDVIRRNPGCDRETLIAELSPRRPRDIVAIERDLLSSGRIYLQRRRGLKRLFVEEPENLPTLARKSRTDGSLDFLVWDVVFRARQATLHSIQLALDPDGEQVDEGALCDSLSRLIESGRIRRVAGDDSWYEAPAFEVQRGQEDGWEASAWQHLQAVFTNLAARLGRDRAARGGGSTYYFDIWDGHPKEPEVQALLDDVRLRATELRRHIEIFNRGAGAGPGRRRVAFYAGLTELEDRDGEFKPED